MEVDEVRASLSRTMAFDPNIHHRRSMRLPHWDYSWGWWYYVTICLKDKRCDFGRGQKDLIALSDLGNATVECWEQIPRHHNGVALDDFVVMPNHVHGILILKDNRRGDQLNAPTTESPRLFGSRKEALAALSPKKETLAVVVRTFKDAVTRWARNNGSADFAWQRGYYDHIIRNDADLTRIRTYIANNPLEWALDKENPDKIKPSFTR